MGMPFERRRLEAKRKRLLRKIVELDPWIQGSLVSTKRICGKPNCSCRRGGPKHPALFVTWKDQGKTLSLYVPRKMESEVQTWGKNYQRLKAILQEITEIQRRIVRLRED